MTRGAWIALGLVAGALAAFNLFRWIDALLSGGSVLYGEGAVAHAGLLLARGRDPYAAEAAGTFVAANYPPLSFAVVALGASVGPFVGLRLASIAATLGVAALVVWRGRERGARALAIAAAYVALFPIAVWGPAHKPDPLAVALTALAVVSAGPRWPNAILAGVAAALAIAAKPTAALALAAVLAYLLWRERATGVRLLVVLVASVGALAVVTAMRFDPARLLEHVVARNALPYDPAVTALLVFVGVLFIGVPIALGWGSGDGRMRAYLVGAAGVVLLGGREGATINYLLDLAAASALALTPALARSASALLPALLAAQLIAGAALSLSGVVSTTGAWSDPRRAALAADLPRTSPHLAEDSAVLIANGIEPDVDDLFLWARLVALGVIRDEVTARVRAGEFASVVAEVRLDALESAPRFERQRWLPDLARAVLAGYRLDRALPGHVRYVPQRGVAGDKEAAGPSEAPTGGTLPPGRSSVE